MVEMSTSRLWKQRRTLMKNIALEEEVMGLSTKLHYEQEKLLR